MTIKKMLLGASLLWGCIVSLNSHALPLLSSDGSLLSGVVVGGQVYDVTFGDALLGDIYPASVVGQPGWYELANAVKQGIVDSLNALPTLPAPGDIRGCEDGVSPGLPAGCLILIPDELAYNGSEVRFRDSNAAGLANSGARRESVSGVITVLDTFTTITWLRCFV